MFTNQNDQTDTAVLLYKCESINLTQGFDPTYSGGTLILEVA